MFIGLNRKFTALLHFLIPFLYTCLIVVIFTLSNLLLMSPLFLKEHKEYNVMFYIHSSVSTFNFILYCTLLLLILILFFNRQIIWNKIILSCSIYGIVVSIFSFLSGVSWGIFSWGDLVLLDNKVYLILFILLNYLITLYIFKNPNKNIKINIPLLTILLISLPFWKILSFWWSTFHQSLTITNIGVSFPNTLIIYFAIFFLLLTTHLIFIFCVQSRYFFIRF